MFCVPMTEKIPDIVEGPELRAEIAQRLRRRRDEWNVQSFCGAGSLPSPWWSS
jgi:hypothetical protein